MFRTFTIIGGIEPTNTMFRFMAAGYATPEQMIADLEAAKQLVLNSAVPLRKAEIKEKPFDMDAFLDKINQEKKSGNL